MKSTILKRGSIPQNEEMKMYGLEILCSKSYSEIYESFFKIIEFVKFEKTIWQQNKIYIYHLISKLQNMNQIWHGFKP
jgi:hypothetical protein